MENEKVEEGKLKEEEGPGHGGRGEGGGERRRGGNVGPKATIARAELFAWPAASQQLGAGC